MRKQEILNKLMKIAKVQKMLLEKLAQTSAPGVDHLYFSAQKKFDSAFSLFENAHQGHYENVEGDVKEFNQNVDMMYKHWIEEFGTINENVSAPVNLDQVKSLKNKINKLYTVAYRLSQHEFAPLSFIQEVAGKMMGILKGAQQDIEIAEKMLSTKEEPAFTPGSAEVSPDKPAIKHSYPPIPGDVQEALSRIVTIEGIGVPLKLDKSMGPKTRAAMEAFKKKFMDNKGTDGEVFAKVREMAKDPKYQSGTPIPNPELDNVAPVDMAAPSDETASSMEASASLLWNTPNKSRALKSVR